ncbi:DUF2155 domain-containing protein [Brevundimonas sp. NPDC092305]|uniref:DUF2155 domain-containing protein n=1 Tax=Brevundimonas sp. NPDC092305 TaxID=3363957 RepID=UPI0038055BD7
MRRGAIIAGAVAAFAVSGVVAASAVNDLPQDAQPAAQDVTADLNRQSAEQARAAAEALRPPPESAPEASPAPNRPVAITPLDIQTGSLDGEALEDAPVEAAPVAPTAPVSLTRRQRGRVAIVEAVDKVTAYRMRFEVPVGGRPVRFQRALIFKARACEMSAPDEVVSDSIAYLEVNVQPRGLLNAETRQVFRGWMFASTPAVSGLQHPSYDAWVVGCKA